MGPNRVNVCSAAARFRGILAWLASATMRPRHGEDAVRVARGGTNQCDGDAGCLKQLDVVVYTREEVRVAQPGGPFASRDSPAGREALYAA